MQKAKIGVLIDQQAAQKRWALGLNVFETFASEVLAHAGIPHDMLDDAAEVLAKRPDVLIAALAADQEESKEALKTYVEEGGTIISFAGLNELVHLVEGRPATPVTSGYAKVDHGQETVQLRFLHAVSWEGVQADETRGELFSEKPDGEPSDPLMQSFTLGQGKLIHWSVDLFGTIVKIQQGKEPVLQDGVPAPDGSAMVNDGILKADDQIALHWEYDRSFTESGVPYFHQPDADLWRELFINQLLQVVVDSGKTISFLGYWPDGIDQVAVISHDSDQNKDEHAVATLDLMQEIQLQTSWCMLEPGYSPEIYERVKADGHELAFHYNALDSQGGKWSEEEFKSQIEWLRSACGIEEVVSNKNHYTRFEGYGELFEWCEKYGVASDTTRGPSKKGNVGYLFGTCHPYFPVAWANDKNRYYDVLQVSFLTQDLELGHLADNQVIVPFLKQAQRVNGVAHFLYHQTHIHRLESVRDSIRYLVKTAREMGFTFWTVAEINHWERYRRQLLESDWSQTKKRSDMPENSQAIVWTPVTDAEEADGTVFGILCKKTQI